MGHLAPIDPRHHNAGDAALTLNRSISRQWIQPAALVALIFAAYFPVVHNGFIWDDNRYIEDNFHLRTLRGLKLIWLEPLKAEPQYYPLTHSTLWLEFHLWGLNPLGYHLDNLLLHSAGALVLWRILRRLKVPGAWPAAAIFAVHPLQVESVAWVTERKNVLSGLLYLLALSAYLRTRWGRRIFETDETGPSGMGWYWLSLLLFIAALLSKSVVSTMPAAILVLLWWKRGKIRPADVYPLVPTFMAGIAMGCLTGWMEKHIVGAIGRDFDFLTPLDRCCIAGRAIWFYLVKLAWPNPLMFIYPHWNVDPLQRPWWILFPLSVCGLFFALWIMRKKFGREPLVALLLFVGTLMPALGFVNVFPMRFSYVADHFQYLACIAPIALVVGTCVKYVRPLPIIAILIALCIASNLRARVFVDRRTLWADTLAKNPLSPMVRNNYAIELMNSGQLEEAKSQFRRAMEIDPAAAAWVGIGQCYAIAGDYRSAREMYQKAIDAAPKSSEPVFQHMMAGNEFQLGTAYQGLAGEFPSQSGEYFAQAEAAYRRAFALFPDYEDPRTNLASIFVEQKRYAEAIDQCQIVLRENPESFSAYMNMGNAYYAQGRLDAALHAYQGAMRIQPINANTMASIGAILAQRGQLEAGIALLQAALKIDPQNSIARQNLLAALAQRSH